MKNILICAASIAFAVTAIAVSSPAPSKESKFSSELPIADGGKFLAEAEPTCSPTPPDQD